ncbi:hypothetical protein MMC30_008739 [Trapelia coarctata]|nr:hypothetical protein [Trapelia coarctata]
MSASYVCLRCMRRAFSRNLCVQRTTPGDRRSFLSLSSIEKSKDDEAPLQASDGEVKTRHPGRQHGVHDKQSRAGPLLYEPVGKTNNLLEELFESTGREKPTPPVKSRYSNVLTPRAVIAPDRTGPLQDDIDTINALLQRGSPPAVIFQTISTLPALKARMQGTRSRGWSVGLKSKWNEPLRELLLKVIDQRLESHQNSPSPTPAEAIQTYISYDLMVDGWWCMALWRLLAPVVGDLGSSEPEVNARRLIPLLGDVLEVWKTFTRTFGTSQGTPHSLTVQLTVPPGWAGLPDVSEPTSNQATSNPIFPKHFMEFFPYKPASSKDAHFAIAAALTSLCVRLVEQKSLVQSSVAFNAQPFLTFVNHVMSSASLDGTKWKHMFIGCLRNDLKIPLSTATRLYYDWRSIRSPDRGNPQKAAEASPLKPAAMPKPEAASILMRGSSHRTVRDSTSMTERLKIAKKSGIKAVIPMWIRYQKDLDKGTEADGTIFAEFMTVFFALGSSDHAIQVWTAMSKYGCKPTLRHWIALLEGCKLSKDLASLQSIWQRMKTAKVQLTNEAWTVYIAALLLCRDCVSALKAIQEMEQAWKEASKSSKSPPSPGKLDGTTKNKPIVNALDLLVPSIVPINAAIFGFLYDNKPSVAEDVLKWAIAQNIKPDTATFNTLIRYAIRHGDNSRVSQLLEDMNRHACTPDVITFSTLFDGLIRNPNNAFQTSSPETQQKLIDRFFADMESNGLTTNAHIYSIILDSLLSTEHMNIPAARALIARMSAQNIRPTPHIYTILITHYFSVSPPDLPAIDALWRRIEAENTPVDHIFYDRMIEGYARIGQLDKMLSFLRRMPAAGKTPGWFALLEALKTLVRAEEWDLVRDLVRDAQDEKGLLRMGRIWGWRGKQDFWDVVEELKERGMDLPVSGEVEVGEGGLGTSMLGVKTGVEGQSHA